MKEEQKKELKRIGRGDLVEIFEINDSGYAGILSNGNIVSRLQYPKAMAVPRSNLLGIPEPKKIREEMDSDYVCIPCGIYFLTPEELKREGNVHTASRAECGVCGIQDTVMHIRVYNWLRHFKYKPDVEQTKV